MALTYFKRYRMEINLAGRDLSGWQSLPGYQFLPWNDSLLEAHAQAKYSSFRDELDVNIFPCLGELAGCRRLMREIRTKPAFLPEATWLALCMGDGRNRCRYCGTIQGISEENGTGVVQNLGIAPAHRNRGLGTALMCRALEGFLRAGLTRVHLEVTADNEGAIRLYRRLGFTTMKTVFKAVEVVYV